jgi:hypothetical protein
MPTTIDSAGITFNDATSLTSANIGTAQLVNGSVIASKLGTTEQKQIAKAWVNFNGTLATPITPRASYNVSSVTKNGTGDYTVNFATAMSDANYAVSTGPTNDVRLAFSLVSQTTSNFRINKGGLIYLNGGAIFSDCDIVPISIFGN